MNVTEPEALGNTTVEQLMGEIELALSQINRRRLHDQRRRLGVENVRVCQQSRYLLDPDFQNPLIDQWVTVVDSWYSEWCKDPDRGGGGTCTADEEGADSFIAHLGTLRRRVPQHGL